MDAVQRWARYAFPFVNVEIGWSQTRSGWIAAVTRAAAWGVRRATAEATGGLVTKDLSRDHPRGAWCARLLTDGLPALERLAARGGDPVAPLKILARIEDQRPARQHQAKVLADTKRLRRDALALERAVAALRRHPRLADGTPLAEVLRREPDGVKPYGRTLYAWSLEVLGWAAAELRSVAPRPTGKPQEREARVAALALTRMGATKRDVGELLGAAGLGYRTSDGTAKLLKRARGGKADVAAAERVIATAVPKNVPAATRTQPKTTPRQPTTKKKTPR
jgi:hypothetical protein